MFLQRVIEAVGFGPRLLELQPRAQHLQAQMIFFVDHYRDRFIVGNGHPAGTFAGGMLLGDQVAFDQKLPIDIVGAFHVHIKRRAGHGELDQAFATALVELGALQAVGFGEEGVSGEIACQANTRGDHNFMLRAIACEPFAGLIGEVSEFHIFPVARKKRWSVVRKKWSAVRR